LFEGSLGPGAHFEAVHGDIHAVSLFAVAIQLAGCGFVQNISRASRNERRL
jgi:hypothetical protein